MTTTTRKDGLLACSFCGKNERQVRKLVAGPACYICDACVAIAHRIIQNSDAEDAGPGWRRLLAPIRRLLGRASAARA